jgi:hypothetical protein
MREEHPTVHNLMGTYMLIFMHRTDNTSKDLVLSEAEPNKAYNIREDEVVKKSFRIRREN